MRENKWSHVLWRIFFKYSDTSRAMKADRFSKDMLRVNSTCASVCKVVVSNSGTSSR
jgi:hypothetical protein